MIHHRLIAILLLLLSGPSFALHLRSGSDSTALCDSCHAYMGSVQSLLLSTSLHNLASAIVTSVCRFIYPHDFCLGIIASVGRPFYDNFVSKVTDPEIICSRLSLCKLPVLIEDSDRDYERRVLKDKPSPKRPVVSPDARLLRFVAFTDIHMDYAYKEGSVVDCDYPVCCRDNSYSGKPGNEPKKGAGKWGTLANCDLPPETLYSFLNFTARSLAPDFFVWLGDNSASNVWQVNSSTHLKSMADISHKLALNGYSTLGTVYPTLGNHEGLPCDEFNLSGGTHNWILHNATDMFSHWLTPDSREMMRKTGCYSQLHPGTQLRVIAVFPLVSDIANPYLWKNGTNPWGVLDWLEAELRSSEKNGEAALILNHFPINAFFMGKQWGFRYRILLDRYSNTIRGVLSGHTHEDSFQLIKSRRGPDIAAVIQINPPLTTSPELNPSFRVYEMDSETFALVDYVQYRLYVEEEAPEWRIAYRFSEFYGTQTLAPEEFGKIKARIEGGDTGLFKGMVGLMWSEGPRGKRFLDEHGMDAAKKYIMCRIASSDLYELSRCVGWSYPTAEDLFEYEVMANFLVPQWQQAHYLHGQQ